MDEVCEGCEWNSGKQCTNDPSGSYDPYNNSCQRVLELFEELKAWKATSKQDSDERRKAEEAATKLYKELKVATKLIKEVEKQYQNGFAATGHGSKYVHGLLKKFLNKD
jgi:hypothetical protein